MKFKLLMLLLVGTLMSSSLKAQKNEKMDSLSYSVGLLIAQNLKQQGLNEVVSADVAAGINDAISGQAPKISIEDANTIFGDHMKKIQEEAHKGNVEEGKKFLEDNAKKDGITTLPSGLQYEIMKEGTGEKPGPTDKVTTHYHGTLINGTVFDSSVDRGQPASFPVNGVIQGWQEALQLMPVGSKWRLFVPSELAYGERGAGGAIGPFATLVFEVELLSID